tara:strand:- start:263 stop:517 length:255 start_codon:yes stop_codon:yes gene_type:complete
MVAGSNPVWATNKFAYNTKITYINIMAYVIIKHVKKKGVELPVIMLDSHEEVWEFEKNTQALEIVNILNANSYSGSRYEVKEIK